MIKGYDTLYFKRLYNRITWNYIDPYLPREGVVPDAGGGTGKWTIPIAEKGLRVVLYDISEEMLKVARRKIVEKSLENIVVFKEEISVKSIILRIVLTSFLLRKTQYLIAVIPIKRLENWPGFLNGGTS